MIDMNRMTCSSYAGAARIALATLVCLFPLASNAADSMPARTPSSARAISTATSWRSGANSVTSRNSRARRRSNLTAKVLAMQKCGYCGRENQDDARNCAECGTELTGETEIHESAVAANETPSPINLEEIEGAFNTHEGFSRPCWTVILKAMRHYHTPETRLAVWTDVVSQ